MSFTVTQAHIDAFTRSVHHTLQQKEPRFKGKLREEYGVVGASIRFERLGPGEMQPKVRHGDTQYTDREHSNRLAILKPFNDAELIDTDDKARTIVNLQNEYATGIMKAYNRRCDRTYLEEAIFPTGASAMTGTANAGLDFDTVNAAAAYANDNEWDVEDRYFAVSAASIQTLLDQTEVGSSDYSTLQAIMNGTIGPDQVWMGFKWRQMPAKVLVDNGKRVGTIGNMTSETNYFYHRSGGGVAFAAEMGQLSNVRVSVEGTKQYSTQVYGECMLGGQVIEDGLIIPVNLTF
jgi:hypothetical protein